VRTFDQHASGWEARQRRFAAAAETNGITCCSVCDETKPTFLMKYVTVSELKPGQRLPQGEDQQPTDDVRVRYHSLITR
jgi:hypothetical protein